MPYNTRLEIRMTEEERKMIGEAAWLTKRSITDWARRVLVVTAKAQIEKGPVK